MLTYPLAGSATFGAIGQFKLETFSIANQTPGFYYQNFTNLGTTSAVTRVGGTANGSGAQIFELANTGTYRLRVYSGTATINTGTEERTVSWLFQKYNSNSDADLTLIYQDGPHLVDSAGPIPLDNFNIQFYHSNTANQFVFGITKGVTTATLSTSGWYLQLDYLSPNDIT
jgi:hypothetical protein